MKRVLISVTNDLTTDQRVHKVCTTLQELGYDITLIGRKLKNSLPLERSYKTKRMQLFFNKGFLFYAEYNIRLFLKLLYSKKDILLANDLDTLTANYLAARVQKTKLVYDSHELFTEVPELINRPKVQKVWQQIEKEILPNLKNCYTVCDSIAQYYNEKYNTEFKVIKNYPEKISIDTSVEKRKHNTIIYQGALNLGRGIELMIKTMQHLDDCHFIIAGDGDISSELKKLTKDLKLEEKVTFLGRLSPKELKKVTQSAHLGISIEEDLGLNYRFALPNKIFDYIQSEIPVLVSNLPEMRKVVEEHKVGKIVSECSPEAMANQIKNIFSSDYSQALSKAKKELNWESEKKKLKEIFSSIY